MAREYKNLKDYSCLRAAFLWLLLVCGGGLIFFRLRILTLPSPEGIQTNYLNGIYSRLIESFSYQFFVLAIIAMTFYGIFALIGLFFHIKTWETTKPTSWIGKMAQRFSGIPHHNLNLKQKQTLVKFGFSYTNLPIRDAAVLCPAIGFIGTVIGISIAIGGLPEAMQDRNIENMMSGLRTAFDTTFIGLAGSLILSIIILLIGSLNARANGMLESDIDYEKLKHLKEA